MKRIAKGSYSDKNNGFDIQVISTTTIEGKIVWFNSISKNNRKLIEGTDFFDTKKEAYKAIKYISNNPKEYGL